MKSDCTDRRPPSCRIDYLSPRRSINGGGSGRSTGRMGAATASTALIAERRLGVRAGVEVSDGLLICGRCAHANLVPDRLVDRRANHFRPAC